MFERTITTSHTHVNQPETRSINLSDDEESDDDGGGRPVSVYDMRRQAAEQMKRPLSHESRNSNFKALN